ncbi:MAG TPA: GDSL-type esterase/lipase family protein [Jatrophihabitans sp.]
MTVRRAAAAAVALLALSACSNSSGDAPSPSTSAPRATSTPSPSATAAGTGSLYVSLGDSYAAGQQATGPGEGHTTRNGFAYQVVDDAVANGYHLKLVNFGCAGATTASMLHDSGCAPRLLGPGAARYSQPQAAAAAAFLRSHRGQVALITVSIGGNDVTGCAAVANVVPCVAAALKVITKNLRTMLVRLRAAAGPSTVIVGTTYPDIFLGKAVSGRPSDLRLAKLSALGFRSLINPTLKAAYAAVDGKFADVTAATGGYVPLRRTTTLAPYGRIPVAVAKVCRLTYFCQYGDIHPRTDGYGIIARLVVNALPRR